MRPRLRLSSHPHLRDLLGVALYGVGLVLIAVTLYAGIRAVASDISDGATVAAHAVDSWSQSEEDSTRTPSNFEQWLARRDTAKRLELKTAREMEQRPAPRVLPGPVGIAAAAKAKAKAEFGSARHAADHKPSKRHRGDDALPAGAQPTRQTGYTPPRPVELHRVY